MVPMSRLNTPLPVGTFMNTVCPSMVEGMLTGPPACWPGMPLKVTPVVTSTKGAFALPRPPKSGTPLLSCLLA
ncbi:hypothetical protein D3C72_2364360 [compost metagenome]